MPELSEQSEVPQPPDWSQEIRQYLPMGLRLATRFCGDATMAEDLLQDALLKAARSRHRFAGQCSPSTWLNRIVINVCRDWLRSRKRAQPSAIPWDESMASVEDVSRVEARETRERLWHAVQTLPERQRDVIVLSVWQQMSTEEVAEALEISVQNVYSNLSAARQQLQSRLKNEST